MKVAQKSLKEIAEIVDGEIEEKKNNDIIIDNFAISPLTSTTDDLVLVFDEKYLKDLTKIKAKAIIVPNHIKGKIPSLPIPVIWVKRPRLVLKKLLEVFKEARYVQQSGVHPSAVVDSSAKIASNVSIGANVYVGKNVVIGENCIIYPNCTILDCTRIGNNVILHPGVVIGSDGYSYVTSEESNLEKAKSGNFNFNTGRQTQHKIPSVGNVIIEDDVEIGSNTCIDRGTIGPTIIGAGTKIDNLVQIAHNCKIGKDCLIVGQVGFAGSVNVGDRVVAGGQCGFADNINIGSDVIFVARSAVHGNIPSNSVYMGYPAVPYAEFFKNEITLKRLPRKQEKLEEQVKILEEKIKLLEEKLIIKSL